MRLARRVLSTLTVAMSVLFAGSAAITHGLITREYRQLEVDSALRNAHRALEAVNGNLGQLRASSLDWAQWDSAYAFVQGEDPEGFAAENLVFQSFQGLRAEVMYFLDLSGGVVWGAQYDLTSGERVATPAAMVEALIRTACADPAACARPGERSGFLVTDAGVLIVSATPILRADASGPARGTLVLGRRLTPALVTELSRQVRVPFSLEPVGRDLADAPPAGAAGPPEFQVTVMGDMLRVRAVLPDLQGRPALALDSWQDREISQSGTAMANFGLALTFAMLLVIGSLILWMLRRQVLRPVARLVGRVQEVRGSAALATINGGDELEVLSQEFEATLRQLEETRSQLAEQSFYTGMAELAGGMTHNLRNTLTPILVHLWRLQAHADDGLLARMQAAAEMLPDTLDDARATAAVTYLRAALRESAARSATLVGDVNLIVGQIEHVERILSEHQTFTRSGRKLEAVEIPAVIANAVRLLGGNGGGIAEVTRHGLGKLPPARGQAVVLSQVFGNILVNAEESILAAGRGRGKITIVGRMVGEGEVQSVEIEITDDGQGISPEDVGRVFERGFSTKRTVTGGIGLHWCANTLASMGGSIRISSPGPGQGATAVIRLPVHQVHGERETAR